MRGSRTLVSYRKAALGFDLVHGRRLHAKTSTFLRGARLHGVIGGSLHCLL